MAALQHRGLVPRTLRELRHDQGLSLTDVSRSSGVSRGHLSMIERGRMVATADEACAISVALGLPMVLETRSMLVIEVDA